MNYQGRDPKDFMESGLIVGACLALAALFIGIMLAGHLFRLF